MVMKDAARVDMFFYRPIFRVPLIFEYFNNQGPTITCIRKHVRVLEWILQGAKYFRKACKMMACLLCVI